MARMQGRTGSGGYEYFAGIDVSKAQLDVAFWRGGQDRARRKAKVEHARFPNTSEGIRALATAMASAHLVVLEPTGRYHLEAWQALSQAGHGVAPVNPYQIRQLASGRGLLAKTDRIDAAHLAEIAALEQPEPKPAPDDLSLQISALSTARDTIIRRRAMVKGQREAISEPMILNLLEAEIALHTAHIEALDQAISQLIGTEQRLSRIHDILTSIPGFGAASAQRIIADLPEIGTLTPKEIAALTGTAPYTQASGQWQGRARTKGGRRHLRTSLHLPAMVAARCNPDLKAFADRLKAKGKHGQSIITATLRKLIILANTLVAQDRTWTQQKP